MPGFLTLDILTYSILLAGKHQRHSNHDYPIAEYRTQFFHSDFISNICSCSGDLSATMHAVAVTAISARADSITAVLTISSFPLYS